MQIVSLNDLEVIAESVTPHNMWGFIDGAAYSHLTKKRNRDKFAEITMNPNFLVDIDNRDLSTTILGEPISFPVMVAPAGGQRQHHPEGELATAQGAGQAKTLYTLPTGSGYSIEEVANVASGPLWFQLYHSHDDITEHLVKRAKESGYKAICLTVDVPVSSPKERDLKNGFLRDTALHDGSLRDRPDLLNRKGAGGSRDFADWDGAEFTGLTWDRLDWLRSLTELPLVIKGIRTVGDALKCVEHGVDGIVVSNHGGRQIDHTLSSIESLYAISAAVEDKVELYLDSGVRRGSDVLIALAMGARGVFVGRPLFWGLAYDGAAGVELMLNILREEFDRALAFCGYRNLSEISRDAINVPVTWG